MGEYPHRRSGDVEQVDDRAAREADRRPAPVSVWLRFAAVMVIMTGVFNAIEGLVGLFDSDFYLVHPDDILLLDLTGWSLVHVVVGGLVAITGVALFVGFAWARPLTVVLATLNAVTQLVFVAVYPVWSLIVIALCVIVIWAVVVHGDDGDVDL